MTYAIGYLPGAESDIEGIFSYLAGESPAVAASFLGRMQRLEDRLRENPHLYQVTHRDLRCAYLRPFQYGVHYAVHDRRVIVIACIHASRDPRVIRRLLTERR